MIGCFGRCTRPRRPCEVGTGAGIHTVLRDRGNIYRQPKHCQICQLMAIELTYLREHDDHFALLRQCEFELGVQIIHRPRDIQTRPLLRYCPVLAKQTRAVKMLIIPQKVRIGNPEDTIVTKLMVKQLHPLRRPLFRTITPSASPFGVAPWVPQFEQSLATNFSRFHDGIGMLFENAISFAMFSTHGAASEQEFLIDIHQFLFPELLFVKYICRVQLGCDAPGKVLDAFANEATLERSIIAMCFCECFL